MPKPTPGRLAAAASTLLACAAVAAQAAPAAQAARPGGAAPPDLDVRTAGAARGLAPAAPTGAAGSARARAQADLRSSLGRGGVLDVDRVTGTVRTVARLGDALSGPSAAAPATAARTWVRAHAEALGLRVADVDALDAPTSTTTKAGLTTLRFRQSVAGIPAFDSELTAAVDRAGRVVQVGGAPARDLRVASTKPTLTADQAVAVAGRSVGAGAVPAVASRPGGARQEVRYADGTMARLVLLQTAKGARLAWHATYLAGTEGLFDAVVDAQDGRLLVRTSLTQHEARTSYYPRYPGAPAGGQPTDVNLTAAGWLGADATTLDGPNARAYSDVDGSDDPTNVKGFDEEVHPGVTAQGSVGSFDYRLRSVRTSPAPACVPEAPCTWDSTKPTSWQTNRAEATTQSFVYNNVFHDHLESAPIGFDAASGNFEEDDPVLTESDDGAQTAANGGPLPAYLNNANMSTPPDGDSPRMQMYLGSITDRRIPGLFRDNNNGEDAATVYHEYTHGLSNRLVTTADGSGALGAQESGSMGEAWSDWYAFDFLNREGLAQDSDAPGEMDLGDFTDAVPNSVRTQPLDCPVLEAGEAPSAACPGTEGAGAGGYTLGDFGRVTDGPEVHADGEIWGETLWDLRTRLVQDAGGAQAGSDVAEALVTGGLRLSPPNPSFLDERNAILQADTAIYGGAHQAAIWDVFAHRGMGYFAEAADGTDAAPVEDFSAPPTADTPTGTLTGRIYDADSGLPVQGALVGVAGQTTPGYDGALAATTGADGRFSVAVPARTYGKVLVQPGGGYFSQTLTDVAVPAGGNVGRDVGVRRSLAVGADVTTNNDSGGAYGCGIPGLTDGDLGSVWEIDRLSSSATDPDPQAVVDLGQVKDVTSYGLDPAEGCGSGPSSATGPYTLESSVDGTTWTTVSSGTFGDADRHRLNLVDPPAAARQARYVRLTLRGSQGDEDYWDFSELAVFGGSENVLPTGRLQVAPRVAPGAPLTLVAQFTDPDSAITGYEWDFDGDGTADRRTDGPETSTTYADAGTRHPVVRALDYRGGSGSATATVEVAADAPATQTTPTTTATTPTTTATTPTTTATTPTTTATTPTTTATTATTAPTTATTPPAPTTAAPAPPAAAPAAPAVGALRALARGTARARVACATRCAVRAQLVVSSRLARSAHLGRRTLGRVALTATGSRVVRVAVPASLRARLRRSGHATATAQLRVTVTPAGGRAVTRVLRVRLRA